MKDLSHLPSDFMSWEDSVARVGDDEEFLLELLDDIKNMIEESIPNLKEYAQKSEFPEIKAIAHSMKGASGNLGLNSLYQTTLNLEESAVNSDVEGVNQFIKDLEEGFEHLKTIV
jgi:HPt (histidine-containing phosphotransfer) domain-containing protein